MTGLGLTKQEQGIVLFLTATLIVGVAVSLYKRFVGAEALPEVDPHYIREFRTRAQELRENPSLSPEREAQSASPQTGQSRARAVEAQKFLLDLNTATAEQLQGIPGIGPVLAGRIVEYRKQNGAFHAVSDLVDVKGIGAAKLEKIKPYVTIK